MIPPLFSNNTPPLLLERLISQSLCVGDVLGGGVRNNHLSLNVRAGLRAFIGILYDG